MASELPNHGLSMNEIDAQALVRETGLSLEQAQQLVRAYGTNREKLMIVAKQLIQPHPRSSRV